MLSQTTHVTASSTLTADEQRQVGNWLRDAHVAQSANRPAEALALVRQALRVDDGNAELAALAHTLATACGRDGSDMASVDRLAVLLKESKGGQHASTLNATSGKDEQDLVNTLRRLGACLEREPGLARHFINDGLVENLREIIGNAKSDKQDIGDAVRLSLALWEKLLVELGATAAMSSDNIVPTVDLLRPFVATAADIATFRLAIRLACVAARHASAQLAAPLVKMVAEAGSGTKPASTDPMSSDIGTFCWMQLASAVEQPFHVDAMLDGGHFRNYLRTLGTRSQDSTATAKLLSTIFARIWQACANQQETRVTTTDDTCANVKHWCVQTFRNLFDDAQSKSIALQLLNVALQVHTALGASILNDEGVLVLMLDCLEFEPVAIQASMVEAWSTACVDKSLRALIQSQCAGYLATMMRDAKDERLRSAGAVLMTKLKTSDGAMDVAEQKDLGDAFVAQLIASTDYAGDTVKSAIEGLAYLSTSGDVKENVTSNAEFIKRLVSMLTAPTTPHAVMFGVLSIIDNLAAYKRMVTAEEEQMRKLREFSKEAPVQRESAFDEAPYVEKRIDALVKAGVIKAVSTLSKNESANVKQAMASILFNCASRPWARGMMVQQGAVGALLALTANLPESMKATCTTQFSDKPTPEEKLVFTAAQALARMAISLDPALAFQSTASTLVRPLLLLCRSWSSLGQFEGLLALTNLASMQDQTVLQRIEMSSGCAVFEELQFSENERIQCAATEALCNMLMHPAVSQRYAASKKGSTRLKLNLALCEAELESTRIAASGILATIIGQSASFCRELANEERAVGKVLSLLAPGESEALHLRGVEIVKHWTAVDELVPLLLESGDAFRSTLQELMRSAKHPGVQAGLQEVLRNLVAVQQRANE